MGQLLILECVLYIKGYRQIHNTSLKNLNLLAMWTELQETNKAFCSTNCICSKFLQARSYTRKAGYQNSHDIPTIAVK